MIRILGLLALGVSIASAQNILYNADRDKTAQDAVAAAKAITSTSVAATQMKNLEQMERDLIQNEVAWTETSLKANLNGFRTWEGVEIIVGTVEFLTTLDSTADSLDVLRAREAEIKAEVQKLRAQAAAAKEANEPPLVTETILERVGQAEDILGFAQGAIGSLNCKPDTTCGATLKEFQAVGEALGELKKGVEQVNILATSVRKIAAAAAKIRVDPKSLAPSPVAIQMQLLATEADYIKAVSVIRARRSLDKREVLQLIREYKLRFGQLGLTLNRRTVVNGVEQNVPVRIEDTLQERAAGRDADAKDAVEEALEPLLLAAAIAARQDSSERIWGMREAVEARRWQIRKSGIYNGSYEATLVAASQRLAAYYATGFKPSQVAQFLYQLGNAFAIPYLVVTK